jgi:hypothetical protein
MFSKSLAVGNRTYKQHEVALRRLVFSLRRQASRLSLPRFQSPAFEDGSSSLSLKPNLS